MGPFPVSRRLIDRLRPVHLGWLAALLLLVIAASGGGRRATAALVVVLGLGALAAGLRRLQRGRDGESARARALQRAFGKTRLTPARLPRITRPGAQDAVELARGPGPAETLESLLRMARDHLGAQEAVFFRITRERDALEAAAWAGDSEIAPSGLRAEWHGLIEWTAREQLPQCDNSDATPYFASVPVPGSAVSLGTLCVWHGDGLAAGRELVLQWLPRYASAIGRVSELVHARQMLAEEARRHDSVLKHVEAFHSARSSGDLAAKICEVVRLLLTNAERVAVVHWPRSERHGQVIGSSGADVAEVGQGVEPESLVGDVYRGGLPLVWEDARLETQARHIFSPSDGGSMVASLGVYPLKNPEGHVVGAIVVEGSAPGSIRYQASRDLRMVSLYAAMALQMVWDIEGRAHTDGLTGLHNRRYFDDKIAEMLRLCDRSGQPLSLLVADIDHFKRVNDSWGHEAGDAVLKAVARIFQDTVRETDVCARYGGEEIVVLLPNTPLTGAMELAERLRRVVVENPVTVGRTAIPVSISIGVATYLQSALARDDFFPSADRALYQAKHDGRNCVRCAPATSSGRKS